MVNPLDSMAWDIAIAGVLLGIAAIKLPYKASSDSVEEKGRNLRIGLAVALGASGFYLFINGLFISFTGPFPSHYSVLFSGAAALGGLALIAASVALFLNGGLQTVSYLAAVVGLYIAVDAYAIVSYELTKEPLLAALAYLSAAVASWLTVPAFHFDNKWARWLFAIFAFLCAIAWLYEGYEFTYGHLEPPPPA